MKTTYTYIFAPDNTYTILATIPAHADRPQVTRPVAAYFSEKPAQAYVEAFNAHSDKRFKMRPPIKYFKVPAWWEEAHPNWNKGE